MSQDYRSHKRLVPAFHFLLFGLILLVLIGAGINFFTHGEGEFLQASLIFLISIILIFLFFFTRIFALKAQNRAIRAEENFRHFVLTGKPLDNRLTIGQIIALRFAPDEELTALAARAASENMSPDAIKRDIKNWKGDFHRV